MSMPVRIEKISVKDLGPITTFSHDLKKVTLIFGHNEAGKTSLVEFVIRSLFQNPKNWPLRDLSGKGKVVVSGLSEDPVVFQPDSTRKIESIWASGEQAFPQDFSKLLVVRAAETSLTAEKVGIDTIILKQYLSGAALLDRIIDSIPKTNQKASIEDNKIIGDHRGDIKRIAELTEEHVRLSGLEQRIQEELSEGALLHLNAQLMDVEVQLSGLDKARRHRAYMLHDKLSKTEAERASYPLDALDAARDKLGQFAQLKSALATEKADLEHAAHQSCHYEWLKNAEAVYASRKTTPLPRRLTYFLASGCLLFAAAFFLYFYARQSIAAAVSLALSIGLIGISIYALVQRVTHQQALDDIAGIKSAYQEKFGHALHGLADLQTAIDRVAPFYFNKENLEISIKEKTRQAKNLEEEMRAIFHTFYSRPLDLEKADAVLRDTQALVRHLDDENMRLSKELADLQVQPAYYLETEVDTKWDKKIYDDCLQECDALKEEIRAMEDAFTGLKQSARDIAGTDMQDSWKEILWAISEKIAAVEADMHDLNAKCMAQILIYRAAETLQSSEEEKILEGLRSSALLRNIQHITKRYSGIDYHNGSVLLEDAFGTYSLGELSTGTIEQVFLSLRMSFASMLAEDERLFLILDDAFQYSDWDRRPRLVDLVIELAKQGWQIIYFTMDDHIRDLFTKKAGKAFQDDFSVIEI